MSTTAVFLVVFKLYSLSHAYTMDLEMSIYIFLQQMEPSIEIISEPSELGEGPFWDKITQSLYFVDILKSAIHKYVPKTGVLTSAKVGKYK